MKSSFQINTSILWLQNRGIMSTNGEAANEEEVKGQTKEEVKEEVKEETRGIGYSCWGELVVCL